MLTSNEAIEILKNIRYRVWGVDIPSPGCPEYIEHHRDCQEILKYIDSYIELIDRYEGIPTISDMYPDNMFIYGTNVPVDPEKILKMLKEGK